MPQPKPSHPGWTFRVDYHRGWRDDLTEEEKWAVGYKNHVTIDLALNYLHKQAESYKIWPYRVMAVSSGGMEMIVRIDRPRDRRNDDHPGHERLREEAAKNWLLLKYPDWNKNAKYWPEQVVWNHRINDYVILEKTSETFVEGEPMLYYHWRTIQNGIRVEDVDHEDILGLYAPNPKRCGIVRGILERIGLKKKETA